MTRAAVCAVCYRRCWEDEPATCPGEDVRRSARAARLPASLPRVRVPAELARRIESELAREQAARPAESFQRADMVRTLLLEALDARARAEGGS